LAERRAVESEVEQDRIDDGDRRGRQRNGGDPACRTAPSEQKMRNRGHTRQRSGKSQKADEQRLAPGRAQNRRIEFGSGQKSEQQSRRAGQKRDPGSRRIERSCSEREWRQRANQNLTNRGRQPYPI